MTRHCKAPGCGAPTTRYGHFCNRHKAHLRRHGAADQRAVTMNELRPFIRTVRARIKRNAGNPLWEQVDANWLATVDHAKGILAEYRQGRPSYRYERLAAVEVVKLADNVTPRELCEVAFAMFLMSHEDPHRFTSDAAFRVQLLRRLRGLTRVNAEEWRNPVTGRVRRAYRELPPKAAAMMAAWIVHVFGGVGITLARMERQQREEKQRRATAMAEAVKELR